MIVLDTNVVSEPTKLRPDPQVLLWFGRQRFEDLYYTATSLAENYHGIESLPDGKRKRDLRHGTEALVASLFAERILPFEQGAARIYAQLHAVAKTRRYTPGVAECQIAAIARLHGFTVATRDTKPFLAMGIPFVNPWEG